MPSWMALGFQDSCSISMGELSVLHDHVMTVMFSVIILITYVMVYLLLGVKYYKSLSEGTFIETIWSMVPAFLLIVLVLPSMQVLYMMEDVKTPSFTFKVVAHQWYWSYVVPLFKGMGFSILGGYVGGYEFDSMLEGYADTPEAPRLLGCSSDFFVPVGSTSRLLITSTDVIHSFALPALGLKVDALPGRVNQLFTSPCRVGQYFGQCSEICGSSHSFMPISMKVCSLTDFDELSKTYSMSVLSEAYGGAVTLMF